MKLYSPDINSRCRRTPGIIVRNLAMLGAGMLFGAGMTFAAPIAGLFNTGVDSAGVILAGGPGTADPHWTVQGGGSAAVAPNQTGFYLPQVTARWINPDGSGTLGESFTLLLQFDLTGFDPNTASFGGRFAADNCAVIRLNGNSANSGGSVAPCGPLSAFGTYSGFSFTSGFVSGLNTISVEVTNELNTPGATMVEFTESNVEPLTGSDVPEPSTWCLTAAAFAVLGGLRRFSRREIRTAARPPVQ